ncbi:DUF1289 domain-containing protein [Caulobacter sp. SLTY]|nr:DUF1289 domain-containing protein [Caulobacter sp. SLTY]
MASPCRKICIVDPETSLCMGCLRTLPEIGGWSRFSEDERERLMAELPGRKGRIRPEKLAIFYPAG